MINNPEVVVALIGALASLIVAIYSLIHTRSNLKKVERIKSSLAEKRSENDAKREYEFNARKRLYEEFEPYRFQLTESCKDSVLFIKSLTERFLTNPKKIGTLPRGNYLKISIIYQLTEPLVYYRILKRRLTNLDLQLSSDIKLQYLLCKEAFFVLTNDAIIADLANLEYTPYVENWKVLRESNPSIYRRQGFARGRLDNFLSELVITSSRGKEMIIGFGEFENLLKQVSTDDFSSSLGAAKDLYDNLKPKSRPILWRIIAIQFVIYLLIIETGRRTITDINSLNSVIDTIFKKHLKEMEIEEIGDEINGVIETSKRYLEMIVVKNISLAVS